MNLARKKNGEEKRAEKYLAYP